MLQLQAAEQAVSKDVPECIEAKNRLLALAKVMLREGSAFVHRLITVNLVACLEHLRPSLVDTGIKHLCQKYNAFSC